jgi:hypothetical protein
MNKAYLTPDALLTSAKAFTDASAALAKEDNDKSGVYGARVARARMANLYTVLWRWDELRTFASNQSMTWPMAEVTQQTAFDWFATEYNKTGTRQLTIDRTGPTMAGGSDLNWLHSCLFATCPGGGGDDQIYAEVVVDECSGTTIDCELASYWTAINATGGTANTVGTMFRSELSTDTASGSGRCLALNIPGDSSLTSGNQVVAYGDASGACDADATQNTFVHGSGLLATPKGFTTIKCTTKDGCCIQASTNGNLSMVSCDKTNANQQWEVESLVKGKPGQIRDKATGLRCLSLKKCEIGGLHTDKRAFDANIKTDDTSLPVKTDDVDVGQHLRLMAMMGQNNASEPAMLAGWATHWSTVAGGCNMLLPDKVQNHSGRCPADTLITGRMEAAFREYRLPGMYGELPGCGEGGPEPKGCGKAVWHRCEGPGCAPPRNYSGLDRNWRQNIAAIAATLRPAVAAGTVSAVFLGDELVCHGVPFANFSAVARTLRQELGPKVLLLANDCGHDYTWSKGPYGWPSIPPELDLVSADLYNASDGDAEAHEIIIFYERYVIPKLRGSQQAVFVPGTFGCGPKFGTSFAEQQAQVVAKLDVLFEYAKRNPKTGGFFGWKILARPSFERGNCPRCRPVAASKCDMNYDGAAEMPLVMAKLREIGSFIVNRTHAA